MNLGESGRSQPVTVGRLLLALLFIASGITHVIFPAMYIAIVPPALPHPRSLVLISGIAEIAGGVGLLVPFTRRMAAWGLVLLLVAVFPANIYMTVAHLPLPGIFGKSWIQWLRLPLQVPLVYWAWTYTRR